MLWCTITTQDHVVGNSGQGMYWQGSDKKPPDGGPRHIASCQEGAPCLYCKEDIVAGIIMWGQVNPARVTNVPSLTGLKESHRQQFPS